MAVVIDAILASALLMDAPVALERICEEMDESSILVGISSVVIGNRSSSGSACCCCCSSSCLFSLSQSSSALSHVAANHRGANSTILSI